MKTLREALLGSAGGWRVFKVAIRGDQVMEAIATRYVQSQFGERILDIGCGYGDLAGHVPGAEYVGIDANDRYISYARKHHVDSCRFIVGDITKISKQEFGVFDCIVALGVLHHLSDIAATETLRAVSKMLSPQGRFIAVDPVWDPRQRTIAAVLIALDRGRFVREQSGYEELVSPWFAGTVSEIRNDLIWFPYTHCILTGTWVNESSTERSQPLDRRT